MMYIPAIVSVSEHFSKRQSLAMGICVCGTGVGTFLLAPAELTLINNYGWRWTLRAMSGLCLVCSLAGSVMTPPPPAPVISFTKRRRSTVVSMHGSIVEDLSSVTTEHHDSVSGLRTLVSWMLSPELLASPSLPVYLLIALADGLATLALFVPFTYLPQLAMSHGIPANDAAFLISATGAELMISS